MTHDIAFLSAGTQLRGALHEPDTSVGSPTPLVIVLTGDGRKGTLSDTWRAVVHTLMQHGMAVFLFDYHGQGRSDGSRSELTLSLATTNFRDALQALNARTDFTPRRIGFLASSFGGAVLLNSLDAIQHPSAIAFKSPVSVLKEVYEIEIGTDLASWKSSGVSSRTDLSYRAYEDSVGLDLYAAGSRIGCPVLIVHGDADDIVPIAQSRRLAQVIGARATLVEIPGGDHHYKAAGAFQTLLAELRLFFTAYLNRV
jgi:alpha-beta hydrolase superfamily lysophospholipase